MKHSVFSLYFDLFRLAGEASIVISLRMMTMAAGGTAATREAQRMVMEKAQAMSVVALTSAFGLAMGQSPDRVGRGALAHYRRKVVANRRRLLRRR